MRIRQILMNEAPGETPTASAPAAPVMTPAAPAVVAPAPSTAPASDPSFLKTRLERERRKAANEVLSALGIKVRKGEDPETKLKEAKAKLDERKEERKGMKSRIAELEAQASQSGFDTGSLKTYADAALTELDEKTRAAIQASAGTSPQRTLEMIAAFKRVGIVPVVAAPSGPATPPATTTPPGTPPAPAALGTSDMRAQYKTLKSSSNPLDQLRAQMIALEHPGEILSGG
jgi:hypothetical protein